MIEIRVDSVYFWSSDSIEKCIFKKNWVANGTVLSMVKVTYICSVQMITTNEDSFGLMGFSSSKYQLGTFVT